jgi:hypothetical protein
VTGYAEIWLDMLPTAENGRTTPIYLAEGQVAHYRPHLRIHDGDGELLGIEFVDARTSPFIPGRARLRPCGSSMSRQLVMRNYSQASHLTLWKGRTLWRSGA